MNAFTHNVLVPAIVQVAQSMGMDPLQLPAADPPQIFEAVEIFPNG